jgi:hypothetical protein
MGQSDGNGGTSNKKITPDKIQQIGSVGNGSSGTVSIINDERSPLLSSEDSCVPKDTCYLTYMIFYLHGIGNILPWNFFITATQVSHILSGIDKIITCALIN